MKDKPLFAIGGKWQAASGKLGSRVPTTCHLLPATVILALLVVLLLPGVANADPPAPHQYMQEYEGPQSCETCHLGAAEQITQSMHYTWSEKMDHYSPIPATISSINWLGVLNPDMEIAGGCGRCHTGGGAMPGTAEADTAEAHAQVDCLVCHAEVYDMSARFPQQDEEGNWTLGGDRSLAAARTAARPSDEACLRCHLNAGGGNLFARGVDLAPVADKHAEESYGDIHAERGMVCVDCHRAPDHLIYGFAPTLWSRDHEDERLLCSDCHGEDPHDNSLLNQHLRLDCRTCHVRETGGLVTRDWTAEPVYDPIKELYGPVDNVAPPNTLQSTHLWHNGERLIPSEGWPGEYGDLNSFIQPFKVYQGTVPANPKDGKPWPLKLDVFYKTGDLETAMEVGAQDAGLAWTGEWEPKTMEVPLQISHGIVEAERALMCQDCHVPNGRMDFAALGYDAERIQILESLSSADAGEGQMLQVSFEPSANPAAPRSTDPIEVENGVELPLFGSWSLVGALLIILLVAIVVIWALMRQRQKLASAS
ncbi:MAG: hypothetical protein GY759_23960 [Chloroflexi bacterium]|nr:hypothetical protein [Chloroflexota bacterium]